jgi:phospholipid/cholesterol/gamma-HCH transport system permease protein
MEAATVAPGARPGPPAAVQEPPLKPAGSIPPALGWLEQIAGMAILTAQTAWAAVRPPYNWGSEFADQCWLCVKRAFIPLLFCTAVFSWGAPGITGGSIISTLATPDRLGAFAIMASVRELATWINGMVIAGVVGTAICSDLGARKIREELDALAVLGTDLVKTLIVPRFLALGLMTVLFNYWNTMISIVFQMVADITVWHQSAAGFIATFSSNFTIAEIVGNGLKVLSFGFIIAVVCCYKGMNAKGGAAGVGRAVNQAVVVSFVLIYVYNYMINSVLLAAFPQTATLR